MKCPYCNKQMEYGYFYNCNQPLEWIPDGKKPSKIAYTTTDDGVKLNNKFSLFKTGGYNAEAHYCALCSIVIAKTAD